MVLHDMISSRSCDYSSWSSDIFSLFSQALDDFHIIFRVMFPSHSRSCMPWFSTCRRNWSHWDLAQRWASKMIGQPSTNPPLTSFEALLPWKTKISPENQCLEDETSFSTGPLFWGHANFWGVFWKIVVLECLSLLFSGTRGSHGREIAGMAGVWRHGNGAVKKKRKCFEELAGFTFVVSACTSSCGWTRFDSYLCFKACHLTCIWQKDTIRFSQTNPLKRADVSKLQILSEEEDAHFPNLFLFAGRGESDGIGNPKARANRADEDDPDAVVTSSLYTCFSLCTPRLHTFFVFLFVIIWKRTAEPSGDELHRIFVRSRCRRASLRILIGSAEAFPMEQGYHRKVLRAGFRKVFLSKTGNQPMTKYAWKQRNIDICDITVLNMYEQNGTKANWNMKVTQYTSMRLNDCESNETTWRMPNQHDSNWTNMNEGSILGSISSSISFTFFLFFVLAGF